MKPFYETQHTIHIEIEKAIYGSYVAIRDKYIKRAKATGKKLVISCNGDKVVCTAQEWMKGAKRIEKVFLIPDRPMILYCNHLSRYIKKEEPEQVSTQSAFLSMPEEQKAVIRAKLGLKQIST